MHGGGCPHEVKICLYDPVWTDRSQIAPQVFDQISVYGADFFILN